MKWFRVIFPVLITLIFWTGFSQAQETEPAENAEPSAAEQEVVTHRVIAGESLFSIAEQYGISVAELQGLNGLSVDSVLQIGQELIISGRVPLALGVEPVFDPSLNHLPGLPDVPKFHVVQAGDTLALVAERYGLPLEELTLVNEISAETPLRIGDTLFIPNARGDLFARNYAVEFGDTLESIATAFNTLPELIQQQNQLLNPRNLVAGQQLRVVSRTGSAEPQTLWGRPHTVTAGETLSTIAARYNLRPQDLAGDNGLTWPAPVYPSQLLRVRAEQPYRALPSGLTLIESSSQPFSQGDTFSLYIELASESMVTPTGRIQFSDLITPTQPWYYESYSQEFPFLPFANGYAAVVGLDAFTQPGLYTLELYLDDALPVFEQSVRVAPVFYQFQNIPLADNSAVRAAENAVLGDIYGSISAEPRWDTSATFQSPLETAFQTAGYGAPRSYAGAPVSIFHSGIDYGAPVDTPIRAAAPGTVVFSDFAELRGNVVIVDHGFGVMSGYFHLSQRLVEVGADVTAGQAIGALGNTGLSTAAHLHWDVRVRGVAVNGLQWLNETFPRP